MNIVLWTIQGLLAVIFLMAGTMKLLKPVKELSKKIGDWVNNFSTTILRAIGLTEILGALGLILPMLLKIYPILTPMAAVGLAFTMIGAMRLHINRKETKEVIVNSVLLLLTIFVIVGRLLVL
ncbi:DoxX family protein [Saccharicrinis sp. 156]|uniref:DoxX family protein n=1 Tax=Saccharicrinis sp. 156 TaxID=3417574 RepID=UPI003D3486F7